MAQTGQGTDYIGVVTADPTSVAPTVSAIVLAYGAEPDIAACLRALRRDGPNDLELMVVDNGCTREDLEQLVTSVGGLLERPPRNDGFAGGCNHGAEMAAGDVLVFVNSDAFVEPGCIDALVDVVQRPEVGLASACIVFEDEPELVNSVGNPVHVTGMSWAGGFGDSADQHQASRPVTSATGCVLAVTRARWVELHGFWGELFAYLEDTDLSLRCWQRGLQVRYVAEARARHRYEFARNELKLYLLERNRLLLLLTLYQARTLLRLAPVLLVFEALMIALAGKQGWLGAKLRGYCWIVSHLGKIRRRRALVRRMRILDDQSSVLPLLTHRLDPSNVSPPPGLRILNACVAAWCRMALPGRRGPT